MDDDFKHPDPDRDAAIALACRMALAPDTAELHDLGTYWQAMTAGQQWLATMTLAGLLGLESVGPDLRAEVRTWLSGLEDEGLRQMLDAE